MTRTIAVLALVGTLAACNGNQDLSNLPVRDGPQQVSPYDSLATNPTIFNGRLTN